MYALMPPRRRRKAAETEVPIMEPTRLMEENLEEIAEEEAATMREVIRTTLRGVGKTVHKEMMGAGQKRC